MVKCDFFGFTKLPSASSTSYPLTVQFQKWTGITNLFAHLNQSRLFPGLSESFEAEGCIVQVSNQSSDILFKKRHPQRNAKQSSRPILTKKAVIFASSWLLLITLLLHSSMSPPLWLSYKLVWLPWCPEHYSVIIIAFVTFACLEGGFPICSKLVWWTVKLLVFCCRLISMYVALISVGTQDLKGTPFRLWTLTVTRLLATGTFLCNTSCRWASWIL